MVGLLDGAVVDGAVEPPDPDPPMFGQSVVEPGVWVLGVVVPPDGAVEPLGAGVADGSAARTTAVPPTTSRPTARAAVAIVRRMPPNDDARDGVVSATGADDIGGGWAGSQAGGWVQSMVVLLGCK